MKVFLSDDAHKDIEKLYDRRVYLTNDTFCQSFEMLTPFGKILKHRKTLMRKMRKMRITRNTRIYGGFERFHT